MTKKHGGQIPSRNINRTFQMDLKTRTASILSAVKKQIPCCCLLNELKVLSVNQFGKETAFLVLNTAQFWLTHNICSTHRYNSRVILPSKTVYTTNTIANQMLNSIPLVGRKSSKTLSNTADGQIYLFGNPILKAFCKKPRGVVTKLSKSTNSDMPVTA